MNFYVTMPFFHFFYIHHRTCIELSMCVYIPTTFLYRYIRVAVLVLLFRGSVES